jgi:ABC-type transporter Mla MlaB component
LTKTATLLALACFLILSAAALSILGRDSVPTLTTGSISLADLDIAPAGPLANRDSKTDKLAVGKIELASADPGQSLPQLSEPIRQAYAAESPFDNVAPPAIATPMMTPPAAKPKVAAKPPVQKTYALLSDAQIAAIKGRLNLSSGQEAYWPGVESALRAVARKIHASRQANPTATGASIIDPDCNEVQQLKSAAMPLLFQLREDQKQEVRSLAHIIGLHAVAAQI